MEYYSESWAFVLFLFFFRDENLGWCFDFVLLAPYNYWLYYLFSNMTSLNNYRHERGFSAFLYLVVLKSLFFELTFFRIRHFLVKTSCRRSRRYRSSYFRFLNFSFYFSWYLTTKSSRTSIFILFTANRSEYHLLFLFLLIVESY